MKLSIIVPVFNEEKTVNKVIDALLAIKFPDIAVEIIIVNDGSSDKTFKEIKKSNVLQSTSAKNRKIFRYLEHKKNLGKGAAVLTGLTHAKGEYILIQDGDLEYHPATIPLLLKPILAKQARVVYGTRINRLPHIRKEERTAQFLIQYLGNRFLSFVTSILYGKWITDMETGYKIFPKEALRTMNLRSKGFEFEPEITAKLLKKGYTIVEIPIVTKPRNYKEGKKLRPFYDGPIALWTLIKYRFTN